MLHFSHDFCCSSPCFRWLYDLFHLERFNLIFLFAESQTSLDPTDRNHPKMIEKIEQAYCRDLPRSITGSKPKNNSTSSAWVIPLISRYINIGSLSFIVGFPKYTKYYYIYYYKSPCFSHHQRGPWNARLGLPHLHLGCKVISDNLGVHRPDQPIFTACAHMPWLPWFRMNPGI